MTRSDLLYVVEPVAGTVRESILAFADLVCLQNPVSLVVEHRGDDGETRLLTLVLLRAEDDQAKLGKMNGVTRGAMAPDRFGWQFEADVALESNLSNYIPAEVEPHWAETTSEGGRPVYGMVSLLQQHRPRLGIPHDGPLPKR